MNQSRKFPPNVFLEKNIFKLLAVVLLLDVLGFWLFPRLSEVIGITTIFLALATSLFSSVGRLIWVIKYPSPPPEYCPTCHQPLPSKEQ